MLGSGARLNIVNKRRIEATTRERTEAIPLLRYKGKGNLGLLSIEKWQGGDLERRETLNGVAWPAAKEIRVGPRGGEGSQRPKRWGKNWT